MNNLLSIEKYRQDVHLIECSYMNKSNFTTFELICRLHELLQYEIR